MVKPAAPPKKLKGIIEHVEAPPPKKVTVMIEQIEVSPGVVGVLRYTEEPTSALRVSVSANPSPTRASKASTRLLQKTP